MFKGRDEKLDFIGFLGWKHRIYTLFTPLEDRNGIVRTGKARDESYVFFSWILCKHILLEKSNNL